MAVRSGRFSVTATAANQMHTIVLTGDKGRGGAFYRILNSGTVAFTIVYGDTSDASRAKTQSLAIQQSFDLYIEQGNQIQIRIAASGDTVEGIYEFLGDDSSRHREDVRSGRFRVSAEKKVVDLSVDNQTVAFYRFYNTHPSNKFKIKTNGAALQANGVDLELAPTASIDVTPDKGKDLTVVPSTSGQEIEGIYEFLAGGQD